MNGLVSLVGGDGGRADWVSEALMQRELVAGRWIAAALLLFSSVASAAQADAPAKGAGAAAGPTEFYIVSEGTSDASPFWSHNILQVQPDGHGSRVRDIGIRPLRLCPNSVDVESTTILLPQASPADLSVGFDICSVDPLELHRELERRSHRAEIWGTARASIVARCGDRDVVIHLPYKETVDLSDDTGSARQLAKWWEFQRTVQERVTLTRPQFLENGTRGLPSVGIRGLSSAIFAASERNGEAAARDVGSGLFDKGLNPECGLEAPCVLHADVKNYVGPLSSALPAPQLVEHYRFRRYVAPEYPVAASEDGLWGIVRLSLTVDSRTGDVLEAKVVQGQPLLAAAAVAAARQWRFARHQASSGNVLATVKFSFSCPQPLREGRAAR